MFTRYLVLLSLLPWICYAQVTVVVHEKNTEQGVEGVLLMASSLSGDVLAQQITNASGKAQLTIKSFPVQVLTSHVAYESALLVIDEPGVYEIHLNQGLTQLDDIVVTGQFEPQSAKRSVYRIRTLTSEKIEATGATRLQDVFNTELNIRFSQDLALGGSNLSLQGLAGQNVKVLIDGVPMVGRQGASNEININQVNVNTIDRVEIVEGPMSVVYGADALAGVINIITKKPNEGTWGGSVRVHEESVGKEYGLTRGIHNESISINYGRNDWYASADVSRNYFGGWQGSAEGRDREWHPKTQWMGSIVAGYRPEQSDFYYRLDYLNELLYNPGLFNGIEALDQRYITNRFMHQVQASFPVTDDLTFNGAVSFSDYKRKTQSVTVNKNTGDQRLALGPGLQDETAFLGTTIRGMFHYKVSDKISFQPGYDINMESGRGGRLKSGTSSINDFALFVSSEIIPAKWVSIRPGLRVVKNSVYEAPPVIPSLNTKFTLSDRVDVRLSYGRGFRAPSLRELYFNFFDASHSIEGNPDLKAELSHSVNGSFTGKWKSTSAVSITSTLTGFYNTVDNMIGFGAKPGNANITTYLNIEKFKTQGLTLSTTFTAGSMEGTVGVGYTGRYNQLPVSDMKQTDFLYSPEINASYTYRHKPSRISATLYYKYTGATPFIQADTASQLVINKAEAYHWIDVSVQKSLAKQWMISTGVRNLMDVTRLNLSLAGDGAVHGNGNGRPVGYGRSYFINVTYSFRK